MPSKMTSQERVTKIAQLEKERNDLLDDKKIFNAIAVDKELQKLCQEEVTEMVLKYEECGYVALPDCYEPLDAYKAYRTVFEAILNKE